MLWVHTNVRIGIVHTCGHVSVFCSSFCSSVRCFCSSVCASYDCISLCSSFYLPSVHVSYILSVCLSVCMFTCTYVETNVIVYVVWTSKIELTWLIPCLVWVFTGHSFHLVFFFRVAVQTIALPVCAPFMQKLYLRSPKKYIYLWAITLYYSTSRLWQWRKVNPKPFITFYNCKNCWYLKVCT